MSSQASKKTQLILFGTPLWKGLLRLSLPVILVNILKTLHDLVDGLFLGRVADVNGISVSTQMQSAVGLTWPIFFVFISLGMGLSVAGNALIGQYVGKGDYDGARKYASNTVLLSLVLGVSFFLVLFIFAPIILRALQAKDPIYSYALTYLRIRSFEMPFLFLSYAYQAIRQSTGDTTTPVIVNSISIIINVILTPILIVSFGLNIAGAALGTLIAHVMIAPLMIYFFIKPKNGLKVRMTSQEMEIDVVKHIGQIAIPASTGQAIQAVGFMIMNALVLGFYGEEVSAAFYIGNRINSLIMLPVSSISAIMAIYIAQNVGAGNIPRAKLSFKTGMTLAVTFMSMGALLIIPFRVFLVGIFNTNPLTIAFAAEYTLWLHLGLPLMGVFQTYLSTFQGSGETKYSFTMAVIRLWLFRLPLILAAWAFTDLGPAGVWYSILISNVLMIFVGMYLYSKVRFLPKIRNNGMKPKEVLV
ncbi:MAG: MATE family efflux transporter [Candidatus Izemoplasmatales bacterium]|nr:MATE family efflux transporter [bacterium]MDZ4196306.1 MATE family efflux transporter [Candidatus Izemoplasmatales bacterium]